MSEQKSKFSSCYVYSMVLALLMPILLGLGCAIGMRHLCEWSFSTTGSWILLLGFGCLGLSWSTPVPIVGWDDVGIDTHPEHNDKVLGPIESRNYSLWKQPNRLRLIISFAITFGGMLLQSVGATFEI
jgi:hypothetical protein